MEMSQKTPSIFLADKMTHQCGAYSYTMVVQADTNTAPSTISTSPTTSPLSSGSQPSCPGRHASAWPRFPLSRASGLYTSILQRIRGFAVSEYSRHTKPWKERMTPRMCPLSKVLDVDGVST